MPVLVFPVALEGKPRVTSTFGMPWGDHLHQGNDIFAPEGTAALAPDAGVVTFGVGGARGGNAYSLLADDGTRYYGAHLREYAGESGRRVAAGEILGYVGRTGNAVATSPHLHFEIHPGGGPAVDPYPALQEVLRAPPLRPPGTRRAPAMNFGAALGLTLGIVALTGLGMLAARPAIMRARYA